MSFVNNPNQSNPVQNQEPHPPKEYGNEELYGYEEDWGNEDVGAEEAYFGEDDFGFGEEDWQNEPGQGGAPLSTESLKARIKELMAATENSEIQAQLKKLLVKLDQAGFLKGESLQNSLNDLAASVSELEMEVYGADGEGGELSLIDEMEKTRESIENNPELSDKAKEQLLADLDKLISNYNINKDDELIVEQIQTKFEALKEEYANRALNPGYVQELSEITGMDIEEINAKMEAAGLDPENLPNPPDTKVANFIKEFVEAELQAVNTKYGELQNQISSMTSMANGINEANINSDTSKKDSVDWTPFKYLYNAHYHRDDYSEALIQARQELGSKVASILSAMYGEEVTAITDPAKAGMVTFNGTELNVLGSGGEADIAFSDSQPEWPSVDLVEIYVDSEGDGTTTVPQWMEDAHYPYHAYDTGSSIWTYNDGSIHDVGHAV